MTHRLTLLAALLAAAVLAGTAPTLAVSATASPASAARTSGQLATPHPLMFVTAVPNASFTYQLNTFSNFGGGVSSAVPGGDLYIRYPDGTLRNLTREAGWGVDSGGIQGGAKAIAVRQPTVHWSGDKALFSMLVGGPTARYENPLRRWQIYEVSGIKKGQTAKIRKIAHQPPYNNMSPIYGSDDRVLFTSDKPLFGMKHTYPQLDEYENASTNTGIWKLDPASGELAMIEHAPSGVFDLYLDSYGRLLFTKWDHLKRDQQADTDRYNGGQYGPFDYADESPTATRKVYPPYDDNGKLIADNKGVLYDVYPEARVAQDPTRNPNEALQDFNQFFIWQINEDGSGEETLNHVGRHEFGGTYMDGVFLDDPNLSYLFPPYDANAAMRGTFRSDSGIFQLKEDPTQAGRYYGVYAQEFSRQAAGRLIEFAMAPGVNPETVAITDYTNATLDSDPNGDHPPTPSQTGHYRNPVKTTDGTFYVSHTPEYRVNADDSKDVLHPKPRYVFQLKPMVKNQNGPDWLAGASLTGGLVKNVRWWQDEAQPHQYNGPLNEVDLVEVRPRARPMPRTMQVDPIEQQAIADAGVDMNQLRDWLVDNKMALIVSRNVTMRDRADISQPFNLKIPGGVKNVPSGGKVYSIDRMQLLQADLTRGYAHSGNGRRVYVKPMHDSQQHPNLEDQLPAFPGAPQGTVKLGTDGSMAAFVPAGRALTWQTMSPTNESVVRERVWVSFAAGEIRTCTTCHGLNSQTKNGFPEPTNRPKALTDLLVKWKAGQGK